MARGSKMKYTSKQKRKAHDIEKGYEKRGVSSEEAEHRAWATVNKSDRGGRKEGGGGRGKKRSKSSSRKGGRKGGRKYLAGNRKKHCINSDEHLNRPLWV
jgi:plasmid stabilization system protein ParE